MQTQNITEVTTETLLARLRDRGWDYVSGSGIEDGSRVFYARIYQTDYDPESPNFGRSWGAIFRTRAESAEHALAEAASLAYAEEFQP